MLKEKVHTSTLVLVTIGMFDLLTTLLLLRMGMGESNPIFGPILSYGILPFVVATLVFLAGPVLLLEFVRQRHPHSAEQGTWLAAGFYALLYVVHIVRIAA
jgi:uncharacterized membrane protein SirB2